MPTLLFFWMPRMSRFKRTDPASSSSQASLPGDVEGVSQTSSTLHQNLDQNLVGENAEELQARLTKVQQKRMRCEFELEKTKHDIEQCEKEAQALGVKDIEELEALVNKLEKEDKQNMEAFLKDLFAEENKLEQIEQQLAKLEEDKTE